MTKRPPSSPMPAPLRLAASFLLIGEAAPFAPATFASFALLPVLFLFLDWHLAIQAVLALSVTWIGITVSTRAEAFYGHDGSPIVIDEVAGMLVTFLGVGAASTTADTWLLLLTGFLLFRIFDVLKPFPAGRLQNLPGGRGVMADDLMAGLYANLVLRFVARLAGWS